jgi:hypothetical protein
MCAWVCARVLYVVYVWVCVYVVRRIITIYFERTIRVKQVFFMCICMCTGVCVFVCAHVLYAVYVWVCVYVARRFVMMNSENTTKEKHVVYRKTDSAYVYMKRNIHTHIPIHT